MDLQISNSTGEKQQSLRPLRLLALGTQEPDWHFLSTNLVGHQWELNAASWQSGLFQILQKLRTEHWDCLIISLNDEDEQYTHRELDSFLSAIRESGSSLAILGLASSLDVSLAEIFLQHQCDFHEIRSGWFSSVVGVLIDRTMQLQFLVRQNQKLQSKDQQRELREQEEAEMILAQQRNLLQGILMKKKRMGELSSPGDCEKTQDCFKVDPLYEQTLRSFVIMGSGRLESELIRLVEDLQYRGFTPHDLLAMHLSCVEHLVVGLGQRSSRHILHRADQMLLDVMVHLAEIYRSEAA